MPIRGEDKVNGTALLRPSLAFGVACALLSTALISRVEVKRASEKQAVRSALRLAADLHPPSRLEVVSSDAHVDRIDRLSAAAAINLATEGDLLTRGEPAGAEAQPNQSEVVLHDRRLSFAAATVEAKSDERQDGRAVGPVDDQGARAERNLTILQLGDSHTAADFFTGRVRERLQEEFGSGGEAYVVPGKPHLGVRSALFESSASEGWVYEALQKSTDERRFHLSGFNAVAHRAGAYLALQARGAEGYDEVNVSFLTGSVGGRAEVLSGRPPRRRSGSQWTA